MKADEEAVALKRWGRAVVGLGIMAAVAILARAYVELGQSGASWKIAVDALIATVGVVTTVITYFALRATQEAAKAALEGAMSVKRIERAHMSFTPPTKHVTNGFPETIIGLTNMGKTPGVLKAYRVKLLNGEFEAAPPFEKFWQAATPSQRAFSPGQLGKMGSIEKFNGPFVVLAAARFEDVFGDLHWTTMTIQCDRNMQLVGVLTSDGWP